MEMISEFVGACSFKGLCIVCWIHESFHETGEGIYGKMQVNLCSHSNLLIKFSMQRWENGLQPQSSLLLEQEAWSYRRDDWKVLPSAMLGRRKRGENILA